MTIAGDPVISFGLKHNIIITLTEISVGGFCCYFCWFYVAALLQEEKVNERRKGERDGDGEERVPWLFGGMALWLLYR